MFVPGIFFWGTPQEKPKTLEERMTYIEATVPHLATKAWVLGGVVGGMALAATLSVATVKFFL